MMMSSPFLACGVPTLRTTVGGGTPSARFIRFVLCPTMIHLYKLKQIHDVDHHPSSSETIVVLSKFLIFAKNFLRTVRFATSPASAISSGRDEVRFEKQFASASPL